MSFALDPSQLDSFFYLSHSIVYKDYFNNLSHTSIKPSKLSDYTVRMLKITQFTCPTTPSSFNFFTAMLYALWSLNITFFYILQVTSTAKTVYLGLSSSQENLIAFEILQEGLKHTYPSILFEVIKEEDTSYLLTMGLFNTEYTHTITSATLLPQIPTDISCEKPTLAPLLQSLDGYAYTLVFLANSLNHCAYKTLYQTDLQRLYQKLFPFREMNHSTACHITHTHTDSTSCTQSDNHTQNETSSREGGSSKSSSTSVLRGLTFNYDFNSDLKTTPVSNCTHSENRSTNSRESCSDTSSKQISCSNGFTHSDTKTQLHIQADNYRTQNIQVSQLLTQIELLLARYDATSLLPIFNFNTFFLSQTAFTPIIAASNYIQLFESPSPLLFPTYLNTWIKPNPCFDALLDSLSTLQLPVFCQNVLPHTFTASLPITSIELSSLLTPPLIS